MDKSLFVRGQRRRMNFVPFIVCWLAPWAVFCISSASLTFAIRYYNPTLCRALNVMASLVLALLVFFVYERGHLKSGRLPPSWFRFFVATTSLAWLGGSIAGCVNYSSNMKKYYDMRDLNSYADVDLLVARGEQLMDAGIVTFKTGAHVDVTKSMGFKNGDIYCVAPILAGNSTVDTVDFWAIGRDCCSGLQADFHCGPYNVPAARSGLRLMTEQDQDRAFYRLAVQQAEATYGLTARHPLFFSWQVDAPAVVQGWYESGRQLYAVGVFSHLVLQGFFVAITAITFSKIGYDA